MDAAQALAYVEAAALALALPLDQVRAKRVAGHLVISAAFASALEGYALQPGDEPAEVYWPAPFPATHGGRRSP